MKRTSILTAVFILAGLVGVGILAREQIASIPGTLEKKYEAWTFDRQRNLAIKCANDQLEYSRVIGIVMSNQALMMVVHVLPDPAPDTIRFDSFMAQHEVITTCADRYVREWSIVQAFYVELVVLDGFNKAGAEDSLIGVNFVGVVTIDREVVRTMTASTNLSSFMAEAIADGRIRPLSMSFFGRAEPVPHAWLNGKLVVEAANLLIDWAAKTAE